MLEITDLVAKLRDAAEPQGEDSALNFCIQAADTIDQLRTELAKVVAWGEDFFGPHRWRNAGDLHSESFPAPGPSLHKIRDLLVEHGHGIVDDDSGKVLAGYRNASRSAADRDARYYNQIDDPYRGDDSHYERVSRLTGVDGARWETD